MTRLGGWLFRWRDYTPLPTLAVFLVFATRAPAMFLAGCCVMTAGEALRFWCQRYIGGSSRTRGSSPGAALVDGGPYSMVRNPLYVANLLLTLGTALLSGHPLLVVIAAALFLGQYIPIVRWEESRLAEQFGAEYAAYRAGVPRWIPRGGPRAPTADYAPPSFGRVVQIERRSLLALAIVVAAFALRIGLSRRFLSADAVLAVVGAR
ncbi:isoprenylcysteine carboxylmethyltransferase family protein [Candidatus Poribacteria bacterium]|jgi:protein-S-isoprenylcysteine O-methyltransferase Ste14|nr:isoprenylcysteine carboxylmethyltransferase family protein [Candidatus Poribacteria bacterium]MBT5532731.1 isoprenylcysteine carboxylmethyltransferase family protein [Candidatus Poribacteria bacterium]MBT5714317.1 isoprenylcysteine carboxylmethyltransferase family protein [Candidatus Poribacteria bacterium]MBT7095762.1 isoprenylcysteine carboxylmethyltransferase family protein [Candidatus Poribacteria bacterium]MBT7809592.1 isoprenylcysteine carboxylmethyltransferase family protein [Candidat